MTNREVEQLTSGDWLMTELLPDTVISGAPDQFAMSVLVQCLPQFLQSCKTPGQLETLLDSIGITPGLFVLLAPSTAIITPVRAMSNFLSFL